MKTRIVNVARLWLIIAAALCIAGVVVNKAYQQSTKDAFSLQSTYYGYQLQQGRVGQRYVVGVPAVVAHGSVRIDRIGWGTQVSRHIHVVSWLLLTHYFCNGGELFLATPLHIGQALPDCRTSTVRAAVGQVLLPHPIPQAPFWYQNMLAIEFYVDAPGIYRVGPITVHGRIDSFLGLPFGHTDVEATTPADKVICVQAALERCRDATP